MPDQKMKPEPARINALIARLPHLSVSQFSAIEAIVAQFGRPFEFSRNPESGLVSDCVLREFGDTLRAHHCFSVEALSKDRFEYALARVLNSCGIRAVLAPKGHPGHDITIGNTATSLKTQADKSIKPGTIHISKFMEMGKGQWGGDPEDLKGLRDRFFKHMEAYERILILRRLKDPNDHVYELVEIPKALLLEAANGKLEMMTDSNQFPKPGTCTVTDAKGRIKFQLYFDGGTERKLQIKHINKALCIVHGTWRFQADQISE